MESSQVCQIQMKVRVCEDERTRWTREERSAPACSGRDAVLGRREGFRGQGESRPDWAATETLSAAWLPPKDSAPPHRPKHLSSASTLSFTFLSPPFVPSLHHPPLAPFLLLHSSISLTSFFFLPPTSRLGHYRHSAAGWEAGVGGCGGGMRRLRGTKALRCSGPTRVAGFEKKPDGVLMQRVDGQTRIDRQSRLSPLSSSFSWGLFWPQKKAHHPPCALPSMPDVLSNTLRCDVGIGGRRRKRG